LISEENLKIIEDNYLTIHVIAGILQANDPRPIHTPHARDRSKPTEKETRTRQYHD